MAYCVFSNRCAALTFSDSGDSHMSKHRCLCGNLSPVRFVFVDKGVLTICRLVKNIHWKIYYKTVSAIVYMFLYQVALFMLAPFLVCGLAIYTYCSITFCWSFILLSAARGAKVNGYFVSLYILLLSYVLEV